MTNLLLQRLETMRDKVRKDANYVLLFGIVNIKLIWKSIKYKTSITLQSIHLFETY